VKNPFASKNLSDALRRRTELAIAVAQERLLSTHVDHALRLIELVGPRVPFDNVLGIYTRLLRLNEEEARVITTRALAILGERVAGGELLVSEAPPPPEPEPEPDSADGRGFMTTLRQRLRGRVNDELRRWVELVAARTEVALLETHVDNALNFVKLLTGEMPFNESVELYLEALEVRDSVAEVAYFIALSRISDDLLPAGAPDAGGASAEDERAALRVVESGDSA
jgi:hypothetical protein